jgi:hypothetical protein
MLQDSSNRAACGSVPGQLLVQLTTEGNKLFFFFNFLARER